MNTLTVNDLRFEVRRSSHRRALEITVDRDGTLILSAPPDLADPKLRDFVQRKRMWVYKQLARRDALTRPVPAKAFVEGEGFAYLGRSYRLRLVAEADSAVKLQGGRFVMPKGLARDGREHLIRWYCERAKPWLAARVQDYAARMEVEPAGVRVQDLGYRWGSCGKGSLLYFHWKTILLPAQIAEYVVVHEMAHLHEPHHTPEFWLRVGWRSRVCSGEGSMFEGIKRKAAIMGVRSNFDCTMRAVIAAPYEDQLLIAMAALPKIAGVSALEDSGTVDSAVRHLARFATNRRQVFATVADGEAHPQYAPWSIVEAWCAAAMLDLDLTNHIQLTLAGWATSLGSPELQQMIREAVRAAGPAPAPEPTRSASPPPSPPAPKQPPASAPVAPAVASEPPPAPAPTRTPTAEPAPAPAASWPPPRAPRAGWTPPPLPDWAQPPSSRRASDPEPPQAAPPSLVIASVLRARKSPPLSQDPTRVVESGFPHRRDAVEDHPHARDWTVDPNTGIRRRREVTSYHPRAAYWAQFDGRITDETQTCAACDTATNTVKIKSTLLCCMCGRPR